MNKNGNYDHGCSFDIPERMGIYNNALNTWYNKVGDKHGRNECNLVCSGNCNNIDIT